MALLLCAEKHLATIAQVGYLHARVSHLHPGREIRALDLKLVPFVFGYLDKEMQGNGIDKPLRAL